MEPDPCGEPRSRALAKGGAALLVVLAAIAGVYLVTRSGGVSEALSLGSVGRSAGVVAESGDPAPPISGAGLETGMPIDLADFAAMPVVINVWASWCPGCNDEAADLRRFAERHTDVTVLGIDFQDTLGGAREFYARWGWRHQSIVDTTGSVTAKLGLVGLPTTIFLDRRHRVVARIVGAGTLADFERGLELARGPEGA